MQIITTPEIEDAVASNAAFAIGVSGGKDSSIAALAVIDYLNSAGHKGPRILIHSDLGSVEWRDSIEICKKLSSRLSTPLITVQRKAGGMMQRWLTRWENNVRRYCELACVKLILPWSTPSMRFCTSELKTAIICRELVQRFRGRQIVNVTGIRRDESSGRAKAPIVKPNNLLSRKDGTSGLDWHPIADISKVEVFLAHKQFNFPLHEAYTTYSSSRVSCSFCIMGNTADLFASASCPENADIYREMCELEISAAFSFQSNTWLSDIAPHLLSTEQLDRAVKAKSVMTQREKLESEIPKHLLYTPRWPECIPSLKEAIHLCGVRREIGRLQGFEMRFTEPLELIRRYQDLLNEKEARNK